MSKDPFKTRLEIAKKKLKKETYPTKIIIHPQLAMLLS